MKNKKERNHYRDQQILNLTILCAQMARELENIRIEMRDRAIFMGPELTRDMPDTPDTLLIPPNPESFSDVSTDSEEDAAGSSGYSATTGSNSTTPPLSAVESPSDSAGTGGDSESQ